MNKKFKILLVDDDHLVHETAKIEFQPHNIELIHAYDGNEAIRLHKKTPRDFAVVLLDYQMPAMSGDQVAQMIKAENLDQYIVIYSGDNSREALKTTFKAGADDFIEKNLSSESKIQKLNEYYQKWLKFNAVYETDSRKNKYREVINITGLEGCSQNLYQICDKVHSIKDKDSTVLIRGESGTGKGDIANAIKNFSTRKNGPFIHVNCGALPENLVESILFGHKRGAFTGATTDQVGKFKACDGGTIFLDEIGDLPLTSQVKLLRVIQEKIIEPVGSHGSYKVDVRIIAATNKDLKKMLQEGTFREDLLYRLDVINILVPPLRERPSDIPQLVDKFLAEFSQGKKQITLQAMKVLKKYGWPGNVRELRNEMEKICALIQGDLIEEKHLAAKFFSSDDEVAGLELKNLKEVRKKQNALEKNYWQGLLSKFSHLNKKDKVIAIEQSNQISKSTIYRRFKELGITIPNQTKRSVSCQSKAV